MSEPTTGKVREPREPRHDRSGSTPPALRCNCDVRHDPKCRYSAQSRSPYLNPLRPLDIDPRPECRECREPYDLGTGINGLCPTCQRSHSNAQAANLNHLREWAE